MWNELIHYMEWLEGSLRRRFWKKNLLRKFLASILLHQPAKEVLYFRIIELAKLERKTREQERRQFIKDSQIKKYKNKAGVLETRIASCAECGEDFCNGNGFFLYKEFQFMKSVVYLSRYFKQERNSFTNSVILVPNF